jgi:hypothetical protein
MRTEDEVRERLAEMERNLQEWKEPDGMLVPTEPDPEERALVRARLEGAIWTLKWFLGPHAHALGVY